MEPIIFAGTPANAAQTLRDLVAAEIPVALVVTREDAPFGRKRELKASEVALAAKDLGLPTLKANRITDSVLSEIVASGSRLAIVVAYGALLSQQAIDALELGWFNLHFSILPRWRGASPVQSALLAGDTETGVTLFKIDAGVDTGPIVSQVHTLIEPNEDSGDVLRRLTQLGSSLAIEQLPSLFAGIAQLNAQVGAPTHAPKYSRSDALLRASETAQLAESKVRAFNPEPVAWLTVGQSPLRILRARQVPSEVPAGAIRLVAGKVVASFSDGSLELIEVQPAGKNPMNAVDWWRGQRTQEVSFE